MRKSLYTPGQQTVAAAVLAMRTAAHLTQRQLAARLRRPLSIVSRIESAQRRVDLLEWVALCRACDADPMEAARQLLERLMHNP